MKPGTIAALVEDDNEVKFINFSLSNSSIERIKNYGETKHEYDELDNSGTMFGDDDDY